MLTGLMAGRHVSTGKVLLDVIDGDLPVFVVEFYEHLKEQYGVGYLDACRIDLCPDASYNEWLDYCFSSESPF